LRRFPPFLSATECAASQGLREAPIGLRGLFVAYSRPSGRHRDARQLLAGPPHEGIEAGAVAALDPLLQLRVDLCP
jgi:hypothetical protein